MNHSFDLIRARVPRDKFFPPGYDPTNCLTRQNLLKSLLKVGHCFPKLLYLEGQAGQGKTTLAVQYLAEAAVPFAWYQLGPEDEDPIFLATALLIGLMESLPSLNSPLLEQMLAAGESSATEVETLAKVLVKDLSQSLDCEFFLVFDDLHLLSQSPFSLCFLQTLLELAPPRLHIIVVSREKPPAAWTHLVSGPGRAIVGNAELALDKTEIATLFSGIFQIPLSREEVQDLHAATEGWVAGLILVGQGLHGSAFHFTNTPVKHPRTIVEKGGVVNFFRTEIFSGVPEFLRRTLYKLSLLDEIPLPLARKLADIPDIEEVLESFRQRNFFIRGMDEQYRVFVFHALFREFLREQAAADMSREELTKTLWIAGGYFLEQGNPVKALKYFLQVGDFISAEAILRQTGMALLAVNRVITLRGFLRQIPEEVVRRHAWLSFYTGVISMDHEPATALSHLTRARESFCEQGEALGEMFALAQLIHFHVTVDARHNLGRPMLKRTEELFERIRDHLDPSGQIRMMQVLAGGYCFFDYNMAKTDAYSGMALELSKRLGLDNHTATTRAVRCYRHAFVGNWPALREEIEKTLPYLLNPRVSSQTKLSIFIAQVSWLILEGNFPAYRQAKEHLLAVLEKNLVAQSVVAPFLLIYDAYLALGEGDWTQVHELVRKGLSLEGAGASPHHRSQFLHFQALARAWEGDDKGACKAAEESRRMRIEVGPGRFDALNQIVLGAAFTRLGRFGEAEILLDAAFAIAREYGEHYLLSAACLYRAYLRMQTGSVERARDDLAAGLTVMRKNGYLYFFGWIPEVLGVLLSEAVRSGVEADYAKMLAAKRLDVSLLDDGSSLPLLHIRSLGVLTLTVEGRIRTQETDLSPAQRQFLALLISAPGRRMSQEQLQVLLWPDSSAEKSRSTFDTLLSRLRKTLEPLLRPLPVKNYLSLQKGIVCLENCSVDVEDFAASARAGLHHARKEEFCQAAIVLDAAVALWKGRFFSGMTLDDPVYAMGCELETLYLKVVCVWAKLRAGVGRVAEAIEVATSALNLDPTNHALVQLLYGLHSQSGSAMQAGKILKEYREDLEREEYPPADIQQALESLWAPT